MPQPSCWRPLSWRDMPYGAARVQALVFGHWRAEAAYTYRIILCRHFACCMWKTRWGTRVCMLTCWCRPLLSGSLPWLAWLRYGSGCECWIRRLHATGLPPVRAVREQYFARQSMEGACMPILLASCSSYTELLQAVEAKPATGWCVYVCTTPRPEGAPCKPTKPNRQA